MTTATNYLKARFSSSEAAAHALPLFGAFVSEGLRAQAWWQAHRHLERQGRRQDFWQQFQAKFPAVFDYLGPLAGGDCDDALLGFLEFGSDEANELYVQGEHLFFKAPGLWHSADWDPLAAFIKVRFGALAAAWIGDENPSDYFDLLNV